MKWETCACEGCNNPVTAGSQYCRECTGEMGGEYLPAPPCIEGFTGFVLVFFLFGFGQGLIPDRSLSLPVAFTGLVIASIVGVRQYRKAEVRYHSR